jgi:hypothetical protein
LEDNYGRTGMTKFINVALAFFVVMASIHGLSCAQDDGGGDAGGGGEAVSDAGGDIGGDVADAGDAVGAADSVESADIGHEAASGGGIREGYSEGTVSTTSTLVTTTGGPHVYGYGPDVVGAAVVGAAVGAGAAAVAGGAVSAANKGVAAKGASEKPEKAVTADAAAKKDSGKPVSPIKKIPANKTATQAKEDGQGKDK